MRFVILGGGPAGYAAASAAAVLGAEVTLIEDTGLGGSCTLTDAIPSKTLLSTATVLAAIDRADQSGVTFEHGKPHVDMIRTPAGSPRTSHAAFATGSRRPRSGSSTGAAGSPLPA